MDLSSRHSSLKNDRKRQADKTTTHHVQHQPTQLPFESDKLITAKQALNTGTH